MPLRHSDGGGGGCKNLFGNLSSIDQQTVNGRKETDGKQLLRQLTVDSRQGRKKDKE
jgi:hypothetical protein